MSKVEGLQMDDLDALLADLGRPKSGKPAVQVAPTTTTTTVKPLDTSSKVQLSEIESLMGDLQASVETKPTLSSSSSNSYNNTSSNNLSSNKANTSQQAIDTSDDLDALMESLNSSISSAIKASNSPPVPAPAPAPVQQQQQQNTYTSSASAAPQAGQPMKFTSTATVTSKKAPLQVSKAVLEVAPPKSTPATATPTPAPIVAKPAPTPAPAPVTAQPSLSTEDLDELLKNLSPAATVTPTVAVSKPAPSVATSSRPSVASSYPASASVSVSNNNNNQNNINQQQQNNGAVRPKVVQGDDLDKLLSNLTSQMNDIDSTGPTSRGTCAGCRKPILGETIQAMGKMFHPEHFSCSNCHNPIGTKNFYEQEGVPHCEKCYQELFCARCAHCDDPITDRCITALGRRFHVHHFVCTQCLKPFEGGNFFERDGRPYCETDFYATFAARCGGCNQPIRGECINALGTQWHPEHFVCQYCQKSFASGTFFEFGGKPYCDIHYHLQAGSVCAGCGKAISGRCVDALDKKYHPEHFVCAFCMNPLAGGSYTANNGKPYCKGCHTKLFS
ncbi:paxillin [Cavenderia fasciculata]|uniref:Paxillin n=1 Tax=Cavenderia fasciculata TaxID=261658 RepID=F4PSX2_CACFS|nr:paxillin [Cavenderia fasciculata]EGG20761.1 paxillin [Cavenderia fasciculata]|eukprot:XP_004358611.1 paxillin [Cavenderia fasciculata]